MIFLFGTIATILLLCQHISPASIGFDFGEDENEEVDKSLIPMIRIPHENNRFTKRSFEENANYGDSEKVMYLMTTPVSLLDSADLRNIDESKKIKFHETNDERKATNKDKLGKDNKSNSDKKQDKLRGKDGPETGSKSTATEHHEGRPSKNAGKQRFGASNLIAFDEESNKKNMKQDSGSCVIDNEKVKNHDKIYENDCGELQCLNGAVTWKLNPLSREIAHCKGTTSIPSMYAAYSKIVVLDDNDTQGVMGDQRSIPRKPIINNFKTRESRKEWQEMLDPKYWD